MVEPLSLKQLVLVRPNCMLWRPRISQNIPAIFLH